MLYEVITVDAVSNEKNVEKEVIFEAIEAALASATKKRERETATRFGIDQEFSGSLRFCL